MALGFWMLKYQDSKTNVRKTPKKQQFECKMVDKHWEQLVLGMGCLFFIILD